jgi:ferredoxin
MILILRCRTRSRTRGKRQPAAAGNAEQRVFDCRCYVYTDQRKKGATAYIIAEPCIGTKDTNCVDVCPVDCIHPAKGRTYDDGRPTFDEVPQLYIDPTECVDCGACVPVCPVTAIFPLDDLPEKSHAYIEINKNYVDGGKFQTDKYQNASS